MIASKHWRLPLCGCGQRNMRFGLRTVGCRHLAARVEKWPWLAGRTFSEQKTELRSLPGTQPKPCWGPNQMGAELPIRSQQAKALIQIYHQRPEELLIRGARRLEGVREEDRLKGHWFPSVPGTPELAVASTFLLSCRSSVSTVVWGSMPN